MKVWQIQALSGRKLRQVTTTLEPGLHVLLAFDPTGTEELIQLLDGSSAPRRGRVQLDGRCPYRCPEVRRHIGSLWAYESLPAAESVGQSLRRLDLDRTVLETTGALGERLDLGTLWEKPPRMLDQNATRMVALAVALSKPEPWSLLLFEPLVGATQSASSIVAQLLMEHATRIPVLVVTSSRATALRFGGPSAELGGGFWRRVQPNQAEYFTLRVAGASLRPLAAEIVRRPRVRSLRLTNHAEGHDELWLETTDPSSVSLDMVRAAQQLGVRIWSMDTQVGAR
jgi:hypothetical protein